ncbi:hypothetical protein KB236_10045 [Levilactobacillus brevis]|uniref:Uncharacterized protein n=1 Tax=Levilactobacillus hammesii TaxID=267633 RepID=A0A921EZV0_9LACO|nr:hypothetical protein KB236_10045 [Levilactobacillus brevis]HJE86533.1 hypothetical protein [Levilactobacillus hammesii]
MAQTDAGGGPEDNDGEDDFDDFFVDGKGLLGWVEDNRFDGRGQVLCEDAYPTEG